LDGLFLISTLVSSVETGQANEAQRPLLEEAEALKKVSSTPSEFECYESKSADKFITTRVPQ
jgi:hypothetical protein